MPNQAFTLISLRRPAWHTCLLLYFILLDTSYQFSSIFHHEVCIVARRQLLAVRHSADGQVGAPWAFEDNAEENANSKVTATAQLPAHKATVEDAVVDPASGRMLPASVDGNVGLWTCIPSESPPLLSLKTGNSVFPMPQPNSAILTSPTSGKVTWLSSGNSYCSYFRSFKKFIMLFL